jgi:hypothetical protein
MSAPAMKLSGLPEMSTAAFTAGSLATFFCSKFMAIWPDDRLLLADRRTTRNSLNRTAHLPEVLELLTKVIVNGVHLARAVNADHGHTIPDIDWAKVLASHG